MKLKSQKKLSARVLKCSPKKVVFDTDKLAEIKKSITRQDLQTLIVEGTIKKKKTNQQSKVRARKRAVQKKKGRRKGHGSRKGTPNSRFPKKRVWMLKIRLQRSLLKSLRDKKEITKENYRDLYMKAKGGFFRSKRHLELYISDHNMMRKK